MSSYKVHLSLLSSVASSIPARARPEPTRADAGAALGSLPVHHLSSSAEQHRPTTWQRNAENAELPCSKQAQPQSEVSTGVQAPAAPHTLGILHSWPPAAHPSPEPLRTSACRLTVGTVAAMARRWESRLLQTSHPAGGGVAQELAVPQQLAPPWPPPCSPAGAQELPTQQSEFLQVPPPLPQPQQPMQPAMESWQAIALSAQPCQASCSLRPAQFSTLPAPVPPPEQPAPGPPPPPGQRSWQQQQLPTLPGQRSWHQPPPPPPPPLSQPQPSQPPPSQLSGHDHWEVSATPLVRLSQPAAAHGPTGAGAPSPKLLSPADSFSSGGHRQATLNQSSCQTRQLPAVHCSTAGSSCQ